MNGNMMVTCMKPKINRCKRAFWKCQQFFNCFSNYIKAIVLFFQIFCHVTIAYDNESLVVTAFQYNICPELWR